MVHLPDTVRDADQREVKTVIRYQTICGEPVTG
jgi:hypothetical protein